MTSPRSHSSSVWEGGPEPKSLTPSLGLLPQLPADVSSPREAWPSPPHSLSPPLTHTHHTIRFAMCICVGHCHPPALRVGSTQVGAVPGTVPGREERLPTDKTRR